MLGFYLVGAMLLAASMVLASGQHYRLTVQPYPCPSVGNCVEMLVANIGDARYPGGMVFIKGTVGSPGPRGGAPGQVTTNDLVYVYSLNPNDGLNSDYSIRTYNEVNAPDPSPQDLANVAVTEVGTLSPPPIQVDCAVKPGVCGPPPPTPTPNAAP
jgi:hypothetical protein